jgi:hypothetical protein
MTELHDETFACRFAPAALARELPGSGTRRICIEGCSPAPLGGDAPAGERSGKPCLLMARQQQARRARGLRGKAKAAGDERHLDFDLCERCDKCPAL